MNPLPQNPPIAQSIELMHSSGKIYVVVGVIMIILIGVLFYLWRLDSKISRLEQEK